VIHGSEKISEIRIHDHSDPLCISFQILRMASFVDRPRRYPKLASSNTGSKMGSNRLSSACWHTRS